MTEKEIFEKMFLAIGTSDDDNGVVGACLVRNGEIVKVTCSMSGGIHAEYSLLKSLEEEGFEINSDDIVYTTVEPCGKRTPGGPGEKMGDCTTNLINARVKCVVYGAGDHDASSETRHKFQEAGVSIIQIDDKELVEKCIKMFNDTCRDTENWIA